MNWKKSTLINGHALNREAVPLNTVHEKYITSIFHCLSSQVTGRKKKTDLLTLM